MNRLEALQARLGSPPRRLQLQLPAPPTWATGDAIHRIWDRAHLVAQHGTAVMGWVYMANTHLFAEGEDDAPAGVVYSFDPAYAANPERLVPTAHRLYAHHGNDDGTFEPSVRPSVRQLQDMVHSGFERPFHQRLPSEVTGGAVVYHSTLMLFRSHLRDGYLTDHSVPLLVERSTDGVAIVVPIEQAMP